MQNYEKIAKRILQLCHKRGLTPNGLSRAAGVSRSTIKRILNGESERMRMTTLKKLCDGFEITLQEFFDTEEFNTLEQELY